MQMDKGENSPNSPNYQGQQSKQQDQQSNEIQEQKVDNKQPQIVLQIASSRRSSQLVNEIKQKIILRNQVFVFILTFLAYASIHATRTAWSSSKQSLKEDLDEKDDHFLGLVDTSFLLCYAISMKVLGGYSSRFPIQYFLGFGMISASVCLLIIYFICQVSINKGFLLFMMMLNGISQSSGWPSVVACMGNWFGNGKKGLLMGLWGTNGNVGNMLGYFIQDFAVNTLDLNWKFVLFIIGIFLLIIGSVVIFNLEPYPSKLGITQQELDQFQQMQSQGLLAKKAQQKDGHVELNEEIEDKRNQTIAIQMPTFNVNNQEEDEDNKYKFSYYQDENDDYNNIQKDENQLQNKNNDKNQKDNDNIQQEEIYNNHQEENNNNQQKEKDNIQIENNQDIQQSQNIDVQNKQDNNQENNNDENSVKVINTQQYNTQITEVNSKERIIPQPIKQNKVSKWKKNPDEEDTSSSNNPNENNEIQLEKLNDSLKIDVNSDLFNSSQIAEAQKQQTNQPQLNTNTNIALLNDQKEEDQINLFNAWVKVPGLTIFALTQGGCKGTIYGLMFWLPIYLQEHGLKSQAAFICSMNEIGTFAGGLLLGMLIDKFKMKAAIITLFLCISSIIMLIIHFLPSGTAAPYFIFILLGGICLGGPYTMLGGAIAIELAQQPEVKHYKNITALLAGIIEGFGSFVAAFVQIIIPFFGQQYIFLLFSFSSFFSSFFLMKKAIAEVKSSSYFNK